ncbi:MAG: glycosyltransferase family 2 protein [Planctomycetota bacterium]
MRDPYTREWGPNTKISVVIPCYNEQAVLPLLFEELEKEIKNWNTDYEVILVDDGSVDRTWEILREFHQRDSRWRMIRLARNFGHQIALRAGIHVASGDLIVILDADLQDPPDVLPRFFECWREGYDVIYGVRRDRPEGWVKKTAYYTFYRILSKLAHHDIPLDAGDFCVMDQRIAALIRKMPERRPFIRGLRSWVGFRQLALPYQRHERAAGKPKYNFRKLIALAVDGILSTSVIPLRIATGFGIFVSVLAFVGVVFTLLLRIFPQPFKFFGMEAIPGTATVIILILFLGGVQLVCLGICGEYVGRIYENIKGRPFWTVQDALGISNPDCDI